MRRLTPYTPLSDTYKGGFDMNGTERKAIVFYTMLANAYREEDDYKSIEKLPLTADTDLTEDFTAMLMAAKLIFDKLCPDRAAGTDLIDFTHTLNRLAIQHVYGEYPVEEDVDGEEIHIPEP